LLPYVFMLPIPARSFPCIRFYWRFRARSHGRRLWRTKAQFGQGVVELTCLAHTRRKFFDLHSANRSAMADEALRRIGKLYEIERHGGTSTTVAEDVMRGWR
jgi:hypothetical protein